MAFPRNESRKCRQNLRPPTANNLNPKVNRLLNNRGLYRFNFDSIEEIRSTSNHLHLFREKFEPNLLQLYLVISFLVVCAFRNFDYCI